MDVKNKRIMTKAEKIALFIVMSLNVALLVTGICLKDISAIASSSAFILLWIFLIYHFKLKF